MNPTYPHPPDTNILETLVRFESYLSGPIPHYFIPGDEYEYSSEDLQVCYKQKQGKRTLTFTNDEKTQCWKISEQGSNGEYWEKESGENFKFFAAVCPIAVNAPLIFDFEWMLDEMPIPYHVGKYVFPRQFVSQISPVLRDLLAEDPSQNVHQDDDKYFEILCAASLTGKLEILPEHAIPLLHCAHRYELVEIERAICGILPYVLSSEKLIEQIRELALLICGVGIFPAVCEVVQMIAVNGEWTPEEALEIFEFMMLLRAWYGDRPHEWILRTSVLVFVTNNEMSGERFCELLGEIDVDEITLHFLGSAKIFRNHPDVAGIERRLRQLLIS